MNRKLGILIPLECMEDSDVLTFCQPHIESGRFSLLTLETLKEAPVKKKKCVVPFREYSKEEVKDLAFNNAPLSGAHINMAIWFHEIFMRTSPTKTLREADLLDWSHTVRLMLENDKRGTLEIIKILDFFRWMETLDKAHPDRFWLNTVNSAAGIRKHWDKIMAQVWKMDRAKQTALPAKASGF